MKSCAAGRFVDQDVCIFEQDMQLNYFGTLYTLKAIVPGMMERRRGQVILVTSVSAAIGQISFADLACFADWFLLKLWLCTG